MSEKILPSVPLENVHLVYVQDEKNEDEGYEIDLMDILQNQTDLNRPLNEDLQRRMDEYVGQIHEDDKDKK